MPRSGDGIFANDRRLDDVVRQTCVHVVAYGQLFCIRVRADDGNASLSTGRRSRCRGRGWNGATAARGRVIIAAGGAAATTRGSRRAATFFRRRSRREKICKIEKPRTPFVGRSCTAEHGCGRFQVKITHALHTASVIIIALR